MRIFSKYTLVVAAVAFASSGCEDFLDVNESPNSPVEVTNKVLLPPAQVGTAWASHNELNRLTSPIMQQMAGAAGAPLSYDVYTITASETGLTNAWRFDFYGSMVNLQEMIRVANETNSPAYAGVAKILKAYNFAVLTDVWGAVPYSEALAGSDKTTPRLDAQRDIYLGNQAEGIQSLFDLVREGLADLDQTTNVFTPGGEDLIYGGNIANWKRFGNTLLLKLAMQISNNPEGEPVAKAVIAEVLAKGADAYITSNAQNAQVKFGSATGTQNPVHQWTNVGSFSNDLIASTRYLNRLQALNDPRLPYLITKPTASYVTIDNGQAGSRPTPTTSWSRFGSYVTGQLTPNTSAGGDAPIKLITNFQRAFILAEAKLRWDIGDKSAQELYTEGVMASMAAVGVSSAEVTAYLAQESVGTLSADPTEALKQILLQKYIAWTGNGYELWNDWRRTGYPELPLAQNAAGIDGTIPVRLPYPSTEISRNPNMPNPGPQTNERVWWDAQ
ncbi:SusD/RagB family nutrient-binding outer membrane lipoprotein [Cesiribacter sp. SM1]|uniref:SusD/RagB family nutrient-binding outer membrane lipoprotein n=1 Tax=Cesiribacter sp. SM1 TaxID=2861196 RepID=UPI001CD56481|nr:SusD/RagB family nutrient-binding outer membrane lipoprotein [Cesiribacter sp. SM1]